MSVSTLVKKKGIEKIIDYALKDPEHNLVKVLDWADAFDNGTFENHRAAIREMITDPDNAYYSFVRHAIDDIDHGVLKKLLINFFVNATLSAWQIQDKIREKYNCNVPWAILMDPTSACNLKCKGCWAAEYGHKLNLSFEEIDDIISQGKKLGVFMYIYTGGEPLVRKGDIIRICEKHQDCVFLSFTNGTLIDEAFAKEMLRVGNFIPAISLEGFEESTDGRRGDGVYKKVIHAMEILHKNKLVYGVSTCYTSQNIDSIISEEFYDKMISMGAYFVWYFHYMPVGNDAVPELLPTMEQRLKVYHKIREYRREKPLFAIDFQNDGEYVGGCIAGGRRYLHINANGDVDPCVFVHYSDSNIREKTLLEALCSPLFMAYHDRQPFNENMLQPCPMLENPHILREMVEETKAHSTDLQSLESADHLCSKCDSYATQWESCANRLWKETKKKKKNMETNVETTHEKPKQSHKEKLKMFAKN